MIIFRGQGDVTLSVIFLSTMHHNLAEKHSGIVHYVEHSCFCQICHDSMAHFNY